MSERLLGRIHALAIFLWFVCVLEPLPFLVRDEFTGLAADSSFPLAPVAVAALFITCAINHRRVSRVLFTPRPVLYTLLAIAVAIMVVSLGIGEPTAILYAALLALYCLSASVLWTMPQPVRILAYRAIAAATFGMVLILVARFGLPEGRWVGSVHPNIFGAVLLAASISAMLGWRNWGWAVFAICFLLAAMVSSRYTVVALSTFAGVTLIARPTRPGETWRTALLIRGGYLLAVAVLVALVSARLLLLDDTDRGVGSGITGRTDLAQRFWPQIADSPWVGYGFRMRDNYLGVHDGILNTLLENGVILGTILLGFFLWRMLAGVRGLFSPDRTNETIRLTAGLLALVLGSFFQPQLINFGDAMGALLLLLLMVPTPYSPKVGRKSLSISSKPQKKHTNGRGYAIQQTGSRYPNRIARGMR